MIKKILLALFTLRYASVSLVIFGIKINHHGIDHDIKHGNNQGAAYVMNIVERSNCNVNDPSCMDCGNSGGEGCCDNETACFVKCSKGVGLYAYTNPKDENEQIQGDIYVPFQTHFAIDANIDEYTIIGNIKKDPVYQVSQTIHYRVGIIQLVL